MQERYQSDRAVPSQGMQHVREEAERQDKKIDQDKKRREEDEAIRLRYSSARRHSGATDGIISCAAADELLPDDDSQWFSGHAV